MAIFLLAALGFAVLILVAARCFLLAAICRRPVVKRPAPTACGDRGKPCQSAIQEGKQWIDRAGAEDVWIRSHDGLRLHGRLIPSDRPTGDAILAMHGYRSSGRNNFAGIAPFYHALGYSVLLADQRAHGLSDGKYIGMGNLERSDCRLWARYLSDRLEKEARGVNIILHGVSMGGTSVLMCCDGGLPGTVRGIIEDCGYTSVWDIFRCRLKKDYHLPAFPLLPCAALLCKMLAGYGLNDCSALEAVRRAELPILFIHGDADDYVPTEMAHRLYEACGSEKSLLLVRGAGHCGAMYADPAAYQEKVAGFLAAHSHSPQGASGPC